MTKDEFENIMREYKKGTYISMMWETVNKNGRKISKGVVRFTSKEVNVNKKGEEYITARITKNTRQHTHVTYFNNNGEKITKSEYEALNGSYEITDFFRKHLDDIIQLG